MSPAREATVPMEIRQAPSTWKWPPGVVGWMVTQGERQVAWFAERDEADAFIALCNQHLVGESP